MKGNTLDTYANKQIHEGTLMSIHLCIPISNASVGLIGCIMYVFASLKLQPLPQQYSTVALELGFWAILSYQPILTELIGLFLGCCLCMLDIQALRKMRLTPVLRQGLIFTLLKKKSNAEENLLTYRKFKAFQRIELIKKFFLICSILLVGVASGVGILMPSFLALIPSVLTITFRKDLLEQITDDLTVLSSCSIDTLWHQYRLLSKKIITINVCLIVFACFVILFVIPLK